MNDDPLGILQYTEKPASTDPLGILQYISKRYTSKQYVSKQPGRSLNSTGKPDPLGIIPLVNKQARSYTDVGGQLADWSEKALESAVTAGAGMAAWPIMKLYGAAGALAGRNPYEAEQDIARLLPHPRSQEARIANKALAAPVEIVAKPFRLPAQWLKKRGYPNLAYTADLGGDVMAMAVLGKTGQVIGRKIGVVPPGEKPVNIKEFISLEQAEKKVAIRNRLATDYKTKPLAEINKRQQYRFLKEDLAARAKAHEIKRQEYERLFTRKKLPGEPAILEKQGPSVSPEQGGIATDAFLRKATNAVGGSYGVSEKPITVQSTKTGEFGVKIQDRSIPVPKKLVAEAQVNAVLKRGGTAEDAAAVFEKFLRENQYRNVSEFKKTEGQKGQVYHRFTSKQTPMSDWGHALFVDNFDRVSTGNYGENYFFVDESKIPKEHMVDSGSLIFKKKLKHALRKYATKEIDSLTFEGRSFEDTLNSLIKEAEPKDIVNSAGLWDNGDFLQVVWDKVLEPNGWDAVKTPDGLVVFNEKYISSNSSSLVNHLKKTLKSERGSIEFTNPKATFEQARNRIKEYVEKSKKIGDLLDVEYSFKRRKGPEVGFAYKNYYSKREMYEDLGRQLAKKNIKLFGHNKKLAADVALAANDPNYFAKLPRDRRKAVAPAAKDLADIFKKARKKYADRGVNVDFYGRIKDHIDELLAQDISDQDRAALVRARKDVERLNFTHIPSAMWFDWAINKDPVGAASKLRVLVTQKRKTFKLEDLINNGYLKKEQIHPVDMIMSYYRRMGRDMALLDIRDAAVKDGWAVKKTPRTKRPAGMVKITRQDIPILSDYYINPFLKDALHELVKGKGLNLGPINRFFSVTKMAGFINLFIMPQIDLIQHGILRAALPETWSKSYLKEGLKHYINRTPQYYKLVDNGMLSKPFAGLKSSFDRSVDWIKADRAGKAAQIVKTLYPWKTVQNLYHASWTLAWGGDAPIRTATGIMLHDLGFSWRDAAQIAAKVHGDYAGVWAYLRRTLNIPFFTPTFKIAMGKFWGRMAIDAAKASIKLPASMFTSAEWTGLTPKQKIYAKGLLGAFIINQAYDVFMTKFWGFKRDQWGRRYYKETTDDKNEPKEVAITWSGPQNIVNKYVYRFLEATRPDVLEPVKKFLLSNRWEFHPIWRTNIDIWLTNTDASGKKIVTTYDSLPTKTKKRLIYATKSIVSLFNLASGDTLSKEARKAFARETSKTFEIITYPLTFKYIREPRNVSKVFKVRRLYKALTDSMINHMINGTKFTQEEMREFNKRVIKTLK